MLIAEQLILLSLRPDGRPATSGAEQYLGYGAAAALLSELAAAGAVELTDRLRVVAPQGFDHPVLASAMGAAQRQDDRKTDTAVQKMAKAVGRAPVVDHLIDIGVIGRHKPSWFRVTRHPVLDVGAHQDVLHRCRRAATTDEPLDVESATLLALSGPCHLLEVVAPDRADRRAARKRIARATERVPAAGATKKAVEAAQAAVTAAATAATVAATSSSSGS